MEGEYALEGGPGGPLGPLLALTDALRHFRVRRRAAVL